LDSDGEANGDWICPVPKLIASACRNNENVDRFSPNKPKSRRCHFYGRAAFVADHNFPDGADPTEIGDCHMAIAPAAPIDGTFPDWRWAVPKERWVPRSVAPLTLAFNSEMLGDFGKVAGLMGQKGVGVDLYCGEPAGPSIVRIAAVPEFVGVQMPMKPAMADAEWPPPWLGLPEKKEVRDG
jgi:hypothetical protein